jgi:hypothetical protein
MKQNDHSRDEIGKLADDAATRGIATSLVEDTLYLKDAEGKPIHSAPIADLLKDEASPQAVFQHFLTQGFVRHCELTFPLLGSTFCELERGPIGEDEGLIWNWKSHTYSAIPVYVEGKGRFEFQFSLCGEDVELSRFGAYDTLPTQHEILRMIKASYDDAALYLKFTRYLSDEQVGHDFGGDKDEDILIGTPPLVEPLAVAIQDGIFYFKLASRTADAEGIKRVIGYVQDFLDQDLGNE